MKDAYGNPVEEHDVLQPLDSLQLFEVIEIRKSAADIETTNGDEPTQTVRDAANYCYWWPE